MIGQFELGDTVRMKKPHACGENLWTITRVGADVKLRCARCGRVVMLDRLDFQKSARQIIKKETSEP